MLNKIIISLFPFLVLTNVFAKEIILPSVFANNHIYLVPTLSDNTQIKFFTDTGGGWNAISKELSDKHNWTVITKPTDEGQITLSVMPQYSKGKAIPLGGINNFMEGHLFIEEKENCLSLEPLMDFLVDAGMLRK